MLGRWRMTLVNQTGLGQPTANRLQRLFGLTADEAKLALEMMRGLRLREAAEALGIEMPMARVPRPALGTQPDRRFACPSPRISHLCRLASPKRLLTWMQSACPASYGARGAGGASRAGGIGHAMPQATWCGRP